MNPYRGAAEDRRRRGSQPFSFYDIMKISNHLTSGICAGAILSALALSSTVRADILNLHVDVNTTALAAAGTPPKPFAIDFQLSGGSPNGNSVTINNFTFGGGSATASPAATFASGLGTGSLASSVVLTDDAGNPFSEFYQGFNPGTTFGFDVSFSLNVNAPIPDVFTFAILDNNLLNLASTDPSGADSLFRLNIVNTKLNSNPFLAYGLTAPFSGVTVNVVPEAGTWSIGIVMGLAAWRLVARRRR